MSSVRLHELARLYGVQTAYVDADGNAKPARPEAVLAALQSLGAAVRRIQDAGDAFRRRNQEIWQMPIRPVTVAWQGTPAAVELRIPAAAAMVRWELDLEDGTCRRGGGRLDPLVTAGRKTVEGAPYVRKRLPLPGRFPLGYHRLRIEIGGIAAEGMLIVAPIRASGAEVLGDPSWGAFLPLYSLWRRSSWGAGDLGDLAAMVRWVSGLEGKVVGLLPMLAVLWELGEGPSPYEPTTRLFWNEFYLDVSAIPHLSQCAPARGLLRQPRFRDALRTLQSGRRVDYAAVLAAKKRVVATLAEWCFAGPDRSGLEGCRRRQPLAELFAKFRAVGQRLGAHWDRWPERLRRGNLRPGDYDEHDYRYYLYSQWQADEQLRAVSADARAAGATLYMDLPLGVRGDGFDVWREPDLFVRGMSVGAPPDTFSTRGQNWGFPPIHPHRQRQTGYGYFLACLRSHLEHARALRLDHVMGLHRQYWIPEGMEPADGVYVRYPGRELSAILTLESHRHQAMIAGENLGTVPPAVNQALRRHRIHSMYVVPFEGSAGRRPGLRPIRADGIASLNTHDLPSFAAFWDDLDIDERLRLGLLGLAQARAMRAVRRAARRSIVAHLRREGLLTGPDADPRDVLEACLAHLGASDARLVMVNLEDLWGETRSPNLPGAPAGYPNWRRRARYSLEAFSRMPRVMRSLEALAHARQHRVSPLLASANQGRGRF